MCLERGEKKKKHIYNNNLKSIKVKSTIYEENQTTPGPQGLTETLDCTL